MLRIGAERRVGHEWNVELSRWRVKQRTGHTGRVHPVTRNGGRGTRTHKGGEARRFSRPVPYQLGLALRGEI